MAEEFQRKVSHATKGEKTYTLMAESGVEADVAAIQLFAMEHNLKPYAPGKSMTSYLGQFTVTPGGKRNTVSKKMVDGEVDPLEYIGVPMWCIYGHDCFPSVVCCLLSEYEHPVEGKQIVIRGYSVYRREPGFRTMGRTLDSWRQSNKEYGRELEKWFINQQKAMLYLNKLVTIPQSLAGASHYPDYEPPKARHFNTYFTNKDTAIIGPLRNRPWQGLENAIEAMGGCVVNNPEEADNIIVGWYANYEEIEKHYPAAILMMEAKIDDFVQELPVGIEQLY